MAVLIEFGCPHTNAYVCVSRHPKAKLNEITCEKAKSYAILIRLTRGEFISGGLKTSDLIQIENQIYCKLLKNKQNISKLI